MPRYGYQQLGRSFHDGSEQPMRIAPLPCHLAVATHQLALAGDPTQPGERRFGRRLAGGKGANDLIQLLAHYADPSDLAGAEVQRGA
ncbi:MAG TPA: hypothetical protein VK807_15315 [Gemmatimonadaceae bacterium]|nr:hypothetical protein [Gemmatimonadaceae bacterium]